MSRILPNSGYSPYSKQEMLEVFFTSYKNYFNLTNLTFNEFVGSVAYQFSDYLSNCYLDIQNRIVSERNFVLEKAFEANQQILSMKNAVNGSTQLNFKGVCEGMNYDFITDNTDNKYKLEINIDTPKNDDGSDIVNDDYTNANNLKKAFAYSAHDLCPTSGSKSIDILDIDNNSITVKFNSIDKTVTANNKDEAGYLSVDAYIYYQTRRPDDPVVINNIKSTFRERFEAIQKIGESIYPETFINPQDFNCVDFTVYFKYSNGTSGYVSTPIILTKLTKAILDKIEVFNTEPVAVFKV